jgi:NitT/TauT family transport system substrate-binding protein
MHSTAPLRATALARLLLALAALALAACAAPQPAAVTEPATPVSLQLAWVHEYSSATLYSAVERGRFAEQGLDVTLIAGGFDEQGYIEPIDQVLAGEGDFGMASAATVIEARAAGKPVVALASVFQRSPLAVISLAESGIAQPADLAGRRVAVASGASHQITKLLLESQGVDPASVTLVERTDYGVDPLVSGDVDALVAWVVNEGIQVREAGKSPSIMLISDYGIDTYDIVLFTTEQMIAERPELVERFLRSFTAGIADVVADPQAASDLVLRYNPDLQLAGQQQRLQASIPLMSPAGTRPGMMQPELWEQTQRILLELGDLDAPIDLAAAYNTTFLERIYAETK